MWESDSVGYDLRNTLDHLPLSACTSLEHVCDRILLLNKASLSYILEEASFLIPTSNCRQVLCSLSLCSDVTHLDDDNAGQTNRASSQNDVGIKIPGCPLDAVPDVLYQTGCCERIERATMQRKCCCVSLVTTVCRTVVKLTRSCFRQKQPECDRPWLDSVLLLPGQCLHL